MKKFALVCMMLAALGVAFAGQIEDLGNVPSKAPVANDEFKIEVKEPSPELGRIDVNGSLDDCTTPFPETFEGVTTPALPDCWVQINVNEDTKYWYTAATGGVTGSPKCVRIDYHGTNAMDDWLISPGILLTGGTEYQLKYWYKAYSASFPERLEVMYGSSQDVAGMTNTLVAAHTITNTTYLQRVVNFTPTASGNYFIGFHGISDADEYYLFLDDMELILAPQDLGRCCYGADPCNPTCEMLTQAACMALGGSWDGTLDCTTPCPTAAAGEICCSAFPIPSLPFVHAGVNGAVDNYNFTTAYCISASYDNGYDVMYVMEVTARTCIQIGVTQGDNDWMSVSLWDACPSEGTSHCLAGAYAVTGPLSIPCTELAPGTYYIMLDNYPSPYDWVYELTVTQCECPTSCEEWELCGTPAETEPNGVCATEVDAYVIGCNAEVYGKICPVSDHDFYQIVVPPFTFMQLIFWDGADCDQYPSVSVRNNLYYEDCTIAGSANSGGWNLTNPTENPWVLYIDFYALASANQATYAVMTACCDIVNYCENPIVIPGVFYYQETVNTCCATDVIPLIGSNCAGNYTSGKDAVFKLRLEQDCILDSVHVEYPGADEQLWIGTDCNDGLTCLYSADNEAGAGAEVLYNVSLSAGTYYIVMSRYSTACGPLTLTIAADCYLPVEFLGADAVAGDGKVTVNWATASELNMDRFEIVRDGEIVKTVAASNTSQRHEYSWVDTDVTNGMSYSYDVVAIGLTGSRNVLATVNATPSFEAGAVNEYALHQNYPNPFNPTTTLAFDLKDAGFVNLTVFNLMGQEVAKVINGEMSAGRHTVNFNSGSLSSGIYLYRIEVNGFVAENKMLLMK